MSQNLDTIKISPAVEKINCGLYNPMDYHLEIRMSKVKLYRATCMNLINIITNSDLYHKKI
jgi:hypothetical protein